MNIHTVKRKALTLLEMMVVIFIIGIIGAVIGINMRGSLNEGKAFKSEKGSRQVFEILSLEAAKDPSIIAQLSSPKAVETILKNSGLPQDASKLLKDGWGEPYVIRPRGEHSSEFTVTSKKYLHFLVQEKGMTKKKIRDDYPWMDPSLVPRA